MEEYPSNSHAYQKEKRESVPEKKVEKVIAGTAKTKKKNEIQKFTDVFVLEDVNNVKSYILLEVLVPAIKKAILDIVTNGADMILYGDSGRAKKGSTASKIPYGGYFDKSNDRRDYDHSRSKPGYSYDSIVLDNRGEAEEVLSRMDEMIDVYGLVSVADLYDLVGINGAYTDNKYGWTDIRLASVQRGREGYMIKLPKALPLN